MRLIAIDPGADQGFAVFQDGTLTHAGLGMTDMLCDEAVIELPEYRRNARVSPNDLIQLALRVGAMKFYYERGGAKVTLVTPTKWKGSVPKEIHHKRIIAKLSDYECLTIDRVARGLIHNVVDAIGLGLFKLGRMGRGR